MSRSWGHALLGAWQDEGRGTGRGWRHELVSGLALYAVLALTAVAFWNGLTGPFLFDDIRNLQHLGDDGGIRSFQDLLHFVLSGNAGPLGRPISLLTFALDDISWPTDPWPFKYTNLLFHLLNGVLVHTLARQLASRAPGQVMGRVEAVALGATAIWLLHPLQLTPVLFVVQRMTELSALFVLAGLVSYLAGRRLAGRRPTAGYFVMSLAVALGGMLAVFSKENGVLLPLFILVIEATILARDASVSRPRFWWRALFLWGPLILLVGYVGLGLLRSGGQWPLRPFDAVQRLLTESRVLVDYLRLVFVPDVHGMGLFHDDYPISRGLLTPPTTLFSMAVLISAVVLALVVRRRQPVLAFAILWFLAGHALEAGPVSLELYFEHRNYLPLLGPAFAASWYALHAPPRVWWVAVFGLLAFIVLIGVSSWRSSLVWGDFARLAPISAAENPSSIRAQQAAAKLWFDRGNPGRAAPYLERAASHHPFNIGLDIQRMFIDCADGTLNGIDLTDVMADAARSPYSNEVHDGLRSLRAIAAENRCEGLTLDKLLEIEKTLLRNPHFRLPKIQRNLYYEIAHIYAGQRIIDKTLQAADAAYAAQPSYEIALQSAVWLLSAGMPEDALQYLRKARKRRAEEWRWVENESETGRIKALESAIRKARDTKGSSGESARGIDPAVGRID